MKFRIFFDMDGVLVDFDRFARKHGLTGDEVKKLPGAYLEMLPIAGAIEGIRKVMSIAGQYGGEVWIATKPPTGIAFAYADKVSWVLRHLPELKRRIILTHDKGLLGGSSDILVDDRPHRANCAEFRGHLIPFGPGTATPHWDALTDLLHRLITSRWPRLQPLSDWPAGLCSRPGGCECVSEARLGCTFFQAGLTRIAAAVVDPAAGPAAERLSIEAPEPTLEDINGARRLMGLGDLGADASIALTGPGSGLQPKGDGAVTFSEHKAP